MRQNWKVKNRSRWKKIFKVQKHVNISINIISVPRYREIVFLHYFSPNEGEGRVAGRCPDSSRALILWKSEGNIGVSSKVVLIFKENRLSLIDRYQVYVDACKIGGESDVWLWSRRKWKSSLLVFSVIDLGDIGNKSGKTPCKVAPVGQHTQTNHIAKCRWPFLRLGENLKLMK